jgi:hypothetical protein
MSNAIQPTSQTCRIVVLEFVDNHIAVAKIVPPHKAGNTATDFRDLLPKSSTVKQVAVSFAYDHFYLKDSVCWSSRSALSALSQLQNIIVDSSILGSSTVLLSFLSYLPNLQQFWICLLDQPEIFKPVPGTKLHRPCRRHHCRNLATKYISLGEERHKGDDSRIICPKCTWLQEMFGASQIYLRPFSLGFCTTLPPFPSKKDILSSECPAIRCARASITTIESDIDSISDDDKDEDYDQTIEVFKDIQACLRDGRFNCSH